MKKNLTTSEAMDNLREEFSKLVEPIVKFLDKIIKKIT